MVNIQASDLRVSDMKNRKSVFYVSAYIFLGQVVLGHMMEIEYKGRRFFKISVGGEGSPNGMLGFMDEFPTEKAALEFVAARLRGE